VVQPQPISNRPPVVSQGGCCNLIWKTNMNL
jgi:hypothetical protein